MLNDTTTSHNYSKHASKNDRSNIITKELLNILHSSPKSFVHLLKMTFSQAFGLSTADAHDIVETITMQVEESDLRKHLANIDSTPFMQIKNRPAINSDVIDVLSEDGFDLASIMTRHTYGDMSETSVEQVMHSHAAVKSGTGAYITNFTVGDSQVQVATILPSYTSSIILI